MKKHHKSKKIKIIKLNASTHNKTKKHKRVIHRKNGKYSKKGGEAIAAGSYGCVFRPPIRCNTGEEPKRTHISKLMYNDETVIKEKEEMDKVKEIIKTIPNNDKYFLVMDTTVCDPGVLTDENLKMFDEKCDLFTEEGINSRTVNTNLAKLKLINMPDGGMEIDDYIQNLLLSTNKLEKYTSFIKINTSLIELLNNGIVPINNTGLNHMDIKGNNMLVDSVGRVRLIDWGLASKNDGLTVPRELTNHSLHFNVPFSNLFYNNHLKEWLPKEYAKIKASSKLYNSKSGQTELLKIVALNLVNHIIEYNKTSGHYKTIISILHFIYKIYALDNGYNTIDYNILIQTTIIEYLQSVLLAYVDDNGNFKDVDYFYEVFAKNADIWGFLMGYIYIIEKGITYGNNNRVEYMIDKDIMHSICRILLKYCYSTEYAIKPINVSELSKELESLNTISRDILKQTIKINGNANPGANPSANPGTNPSATQLKTETQPRNLEYLNESGNLVEDISE